MKPPRPLDDVCFAILKVIPDEYIHKKALAQSFEVIQTASLYTAPEAMTPYWTMATGALTSAMQEAHMENLYWADTVRQVWNDEIDYKGFII